MLSNPFLLPAFLIAIVACPGASVQQNGSDETVKRRNAPQDAWDGWTTFAAAPGAQIVYVSSQGNDGNPGTEAQPKQTLTGGYALLRDGKPDWLLLKRGDVFPNPGAFIWLKSGPTTGTSWMRLGAYGNDNDPRPVIDTGSAGYFVISPGFQSSRQIAHLAITDVHFFASARVAAPATATSAPSGIQTVAVGWTGTGYPFTSILLENNRIEGYALGFAGSSDTQDLSIRRCIFDHIFQLQAPCTAVLTGASGCLLEENIFYQVQSPDIPGVGPYSQLSHAVYVGAEARNVVSRGNIIIKAPDGIMQRAGGVYSRNVIIGCNVAGLLGQAWGVTPTPGGVDVLFEDSLLLNPLSLHFYLGNTASGTVRNNLFLRDLTGTMTCDLSLVPRNNQGGGVNIGVHNTAFVDNFLSGIISWNPGAPRSFSGLTFQNNQESRGQTNTSIAAYLSAMGLSGSTVDNLAGHLLSRDRSNFVRAPTAVSLINAYRRALGLQPIR